MIKTTSHTKIVAKSGMMDAYMLGRAITSREEWLWKARHGEMEDRSRRVQTAREYHRQALRHMRNLRSANQLGEEHGSR